MKKLFLIACVMFMAMSASAQITWNAKGGVGIAHCWGDAKGLKPAVVGKLGVGIEKPLSSNWSLMPSFEVALKGCKIDWAKVADGSESSRMNALYLQIPVMAAYRININDSWNTTLKAGPYFAVGVYGDIDGYNIFKSEDGADGASRFDVGLDLGVDFEYHRFVFGVEYELGFISMSPVKDSVRNGAFYATVGWKF